MQTINSPDIQVMDYDVLLDTSTPNPSITLTNQSLASAPANLAWVFELYSPSGTPIHAGTFDAPDIVGIWNTPYIRNSGFPKPNGVLEFSGRPYTVVVTVRDSGGQKVSLTKNIRVCKPSGFDPKNKTANGKAVISVITKCNIGKLWIEDKTNYSYGGVQPATSVKNFKLFFPADDTGIPSVPSSNTYHLIYPTDDQTVGSPIGVSISNFNSGLIRIAQSGPGYQYFMTSIMDYNMGDRVTVRVKYLDRNIFTVACNLDLSPIACELEKLIDQYENGRCADSADADRKIKLVSAKLHLAVIGIMYPQNSIDPYKKIDEIKELTGWACDCCPTGMGASGAVSEDTGLSFDVDLGGDLDGSFEILGSTVMLHLEDFAYVIQISSDSTSAAFSIVPATLGRVKTYYLKIVRATLADEILASFEGSTTFKNRLNALLSVNMAAGTVNVNKRCLTIEGAAGDSYNYIYTSDALLTGQTLQLKYLNNGGQIVYINILFDQTNAAAVQTRLNALGLGAWTAAFTGGKLTLTSNGNPNSNLLELVVHNSVSSANTDTELVQSKQKTTVTVYGVQSVFQALIDFVCGTIMTNLQVGVGLSIKCLSALGSAINMVEIKTDDNLVSLFTRFVDCHNKIVDIVSQWKAADCDAIKAIFNTADIGGLEDADQFLMNINGRCMTATPKYVAMKIFDLATKDQQVKDLACLAVAGCTKSICNPVTNATAVYDAAGSTLTTDITNTGAQRYRVAYRPVGLGRPQFIGTDIVNAANGAVTNKQWTGVAAGQWEISITPLCADGTEGAQFLVQTLACVDPTNINVILNGSVFEVRFSGLPANAAKIRIEAVYPNNGSFGQNYATNVAQPITIPVPSGVYGDYSFVAKTVCNEAQAWYSAGTAPMKLNIPSPAACPFVQSVSITDITGSTVTIKAVKPTVGTQPNNYTLRLTPQNGTPALLYTSATPGSFVTFLPTNLTPGVEYAVEVISNCINGTGDPFYAGRFLTQPAVGTTGGIISNEGSPHFASSVALMVNGVLVYNSGQLNPGADTTAFLISNYVGAEIRLKPCDAQATNARLVSNGVTYNPVAVDPDGTFVFNGVTIPNLSLHAYFS